MLTANQLSRVFIYEHSGTELRLSDPDSRKTPEAVMNFYSHNYPLLTTVKIQGPEIKDDQLQYRFVSTLGTKG